MIGEPRLESASAATFVGVSASMSFTTNRTADLWRTFMPRRDEVPHRVGTELYSIEQYPAGFFDEFDPARPFVKWAAVAVAGAEPAPPGMERLAAPAGRYAVFLHVGPASAGPRTYGHIFNTWFPQSGYLVDDRPHLAVMGAKYSAQSQDSEEELWIPIRQATPSG